MKIQYLFKVLQIFSGLSIHLFLKKMYKQLTLFSLFFFIVTGDLYSQSMFQKTFGSSNEEAEGRYYPLSNGGGILTGRTGTPGSYDISVIKLDESFEIIWSKKFGGANEYEGVKSFIELPDGNYFITGIGEYGSTTIWLFISPSGELIDSYEFGSYHDRLRNVLLNGTGNLVVYGELQGMVGSANQLSTIKLDQNFNPVWKKSYDQTVQWGGREVQSRLGAIHLNPGYIFIGSLQDIGATPSRIRLYKTDEDGNLEWVKGYHGGRKDDTRYITRNKTDDGFMIIAASDSYSNSANSYDILLISIDKAGNLKWAKTYGGEGSDDAKHIISDDEENFIISGNTTSFGFGNNDAFLLKINANGDLLTAKTYGSENEDFFWNANIVPDGYIMSGSSHNDFLIVKTDKEGNHGGCEMEVTSSVIVKDVAVNVTSELYPEESFSDPIKRSINKSSENITANIVCELCEPPSLDFGSDLEICQEDSYLLKAKSENVLWNNGSTDSIFLVTETGWYSATIQNGCGSATDSIYIDIINFENLIIPNIITPNDDGKNDNFIIDYRLIGSEIYIYNRWGKVVYENESYSNNWKGDDLASGIYFYTINNHCLNEKIKGWIEIIR